MPVQKLDVEAQYHSFTNQMFSDFEIVAGRKPNAKNQDLKLPIARLILGALTVGSAFMCGKGLIVGSGKMIQFAACIVCSHDGYRILQNKQKYESPKGDRVANTTFNHRDLPKLIWAVFMSFKDQFAKDIDSAFSKSNPEAEKVPEQKTESKYAWSRLASGSVMVLSTLAFTVKAVNTIIGMAAFLAVGSLSFWAFKRLQDPKEVEKGIAADKGGAGAAADQEVDDEEVIQRKAAIFTEGTILPLQKVAAFCLRYFGGKAKAPEAA